MKILLKELRSLIRNVLLEKTRYKEENIELGKDIDILKKYKDIGFVHFSDLNKLGINPQSNYNTPLGIYGYPITDNFINDYEIDEIPFASEREFCHIFKPKSYNNIISLQHITEEEFDFYIKKLNNILHIPQEMIRQIIEYANSFGEALWTYTYMFHNASKESTYNVDHIKQLNISTNPLKWNKLFRSVGIDGVIDFNGGIIHPNEPSQAVFFSKDVLEQVDVIEPKRFKEKKFLEKDKLAFDRLKLTNDKEIIKKVILSNRINLQLAVALNPNLPVEFIKLINNLKTIEYIANFSKSQEILEEIFDLYKNNLDVYLFLLHNKKLSLDLLTKMYDMCVKNVSSFKKENVFLILNTISDHVNVSMDLLYQIEEFINFSLLFNKE